MTSPIACTPKNPAAEPTARARVGSGPAPGAAEPVLVLCFQRGSCRRSEGRPVPPEGLVLGRDGRVFDELGGDPRLSPRHARIGPDGRGRVTVQDLGSAHGTWLNGARLTREAALVPGDVLRLGDSVLAYVNASATQGVGPDDGLVGSGREMLAVRRGIERVAARGHSVVVTGETGTGKEVVARLIHERSGRTGPFIAVNCGTFTGDLLASELFGHVRGAFTGAIAENTGLFRAARGGTLLLDELADIPLQVQASLLRVLETRSVRPVGGTKDLDIDVRIVATSNRELVELVQAGRFRADLYARLAQWTIRTPNLAARREDLPELVAHLLPRVEGKGRRLTPDLCEALLLHPWPLNVRGLLNILSIAVICTDDERSPLALCAEVADELRQMRSLESPGVASSTLADPIRLDVVRPVEPLAAPVPTLNRGDLEGLMTRFEGHVAAAARDLGMTRPTLYRMLGDHGLEPGTFRRPAGRGRSASCSA